MSGDDLLAPSFASEYLLPAPKRTGGAPLFDALGRRRSTRSYSDRALRPQVLSDLLWCAAGVNRPEHGGRTAPSARNWQEIDVYVALADGAYVYEPRRHRLRLVDPADLRGCTGLQDFVPRASLNLVYVADLTKVGGIDPVERRFYTAADAAFMAQNVYLFCASEGLGAVVRGLVDRRAVAKAFHLGAHQRVILAQTAGYPA